MTAPEFLGRVRAAQAQQEDFDDVVEEFGVGCPCKTPALKSKGKQHLGTATHKKAFEDPSGPFFGRTVREALEARAAAQGVDVILVGGSAAIQGNDNAGVNAGGFERFDDVNEYEVFDGEAESPEEERPQDEADEDLSDIVAED
jgi:hypothetical protein